MSEHAYNENLVKKTYSAKDYVQDGLIAIWDAIENVNFGVHDPNAVVWKNLVSGELLSVPADKYSWGSNYLLLASFSATGTGTETNLTGSEFLQKFNKAVEFNRTWTLENVSAIDTWHENYGSSQTYSGRWAIHPITTYYYGPCPCGKGEVRFDFSGSGQGQYWGPYITGLNCVRPMHIAHVISPSDGFVRKVCSKGYIDGMLAGVANPTPDNRVEDNDVLISNWVSSVATTWKVGGRYEGANTDRIFCFRVYERSLSDAEILHNYEVDKERFGL